MMATEPECSALNFEVAGPELGGAGDGYGPQLQEARQDGVPLGHLAEEDHHPVAAAYAQLLRRAREPVRRGRENWAKSKRRSSPFVPSQIMAARSCAAHLSTTSRPKLNLSGVSQSKVA